MVTPQDVPQLTAQPLWRQIADHLRQLILSGHYPAGQPLPAEERLADLYGVSRTAVRQGVKTLVREGLLTVRRPFGTIVRDPHARPPAEPRGLSIVDGRFMDDDPRDWTEVGAASFTRTDADVWHAEVFGIRPGEPMLTRETLHQTDTGRRSVRLLMPFRVAADLSTPWQDDPHLPAALDLYTWLHDNGHPLTFTEQVRARMPVGDEASALRMNPETPLLILTRTARTAQRALTVEETHTPADQSEPAYPLLVTTPGRPKPARTSRTR